VLLKLTTILAVFLVWVPVAQAWSWPVQGPVLKPFSYDEAHPYDAGQHRGIDVGATATGDPVVAPEDGTVSFAGYVPTSGESLTIETADGYSVTLTHLGSIAVSEGATVTEGDAVATVGPSGAPEQSVPYVHLGIRLTSDELGYVDPLGLLPVPEPPPPTPTPAPQPVPTPEPAPVPVRTAAPTHAQPGGLVIEKPAVAPRPVTVPAESPLVAQPKPQATPRPKSAPAPETFRTDAPEIRQPASTARPVVAPVAAPSRPVPPVSVVLLGALVLALAVGATALLVVRRRASESAEPPLVQLTDALLPDNAYLLRQRDAEHRQRVHDDDRGHPRAPSKAAWSGHVLPHGCRRARHESLARRRAAGARGAGVRRPHRRAVARARTAP
jgi:murein DD-endopeptidase MepM/ murein hydrolase activator NlpD